MATADQEYRPIRELGRGGMGTVYLAEQVRLGRLVAVKTLLPGALAIADLAARFCREAELLRTLSHPNLVRLLDARLDGDNPFLVFEYIEESEPLDAVIERGSLGRAAALATISGVFEGLSHLHAKGILHRDIKPGNILLDRSGTPRLIDLGLGRAVDADQTRLTREGQVMGTMAYIPPEQLLGLDADERSDIYAAALVAAELLAGHFLFTNRAPGGGISAPDRIGDRPLRLDRLVPGLPPRLERLLDRCLSREPADRPARLPEVLAELERCGEPARPPARPRASGSTKVLAPAPRAPTAPRARVGVAVALVLSAGLALVWAASGPRPRPTPAPSQAPPTPAPLRLELESYVRWAPEGLLLEAHLSRPARLAVRATSSAEPLAVTTAVAARHTLLLGSPRYPREGLSVGALDESVPLSLEHVQRRLVELALRVLSDAQPAAVVTALDRRLARVARGARGPAAGEVLPKGMEDRIRCLAPWLSSALAEGPLSGTQAELWNAVEEWGAVEDWCVARSLSWAAPPSLFQPRAHTALLAVDTPRWNQLMVGLALRQARVPEVQSIWGARFVTDRASGPRAGIQIFTGTADLELPSAEAVNLLVPGSNLHTTLVLDVPAGDVPRPHAWIGYKPTARKATGQLVAVFPGNVKLRLPMVGHEPEWFRYRRLPPGLPRPGPCPVQLVYHQTPGTTVAERFTFFGLHLLRGPAEIPSGPVVHHLWGAP